MKRLLIAAGIACLPAPALAVDFNDYGSHHLAPTYQVVNGHGRTVRIVDIGLEKWYDWIIAPDDGSGLWMRVETTFLGAPSACDPSVYETQVAHEYVSRKGTIWEMAGQREWECGNGMLHLYADAGGYMSGGAGSREPILIAPGPGDDRSIYSEWWSEPYPYRHQPEGYPKTKWLKTDAAYSYAKVVEEIPVMTVQPDGYPATTYYDVVKVFWKHGGWYDTSKGFPCGSDTPGKFALPNHNVYGKYVWYARDIAGQKGGMVKETLLWYCRQAADGRFEPIGTWAPGADAKTFTYYRSP
jgi:hypothetical protein